MEVQGGRQRGLQFPEHGVVAVVLPVALTLVQPAPLRLHRVRLHASVLVVDLYYIRSQIYCKHLLLFNIT